MYGSNCCCCYYYPTVLFSVGTYKVSIWDRRARVLLLETGGQVEQETSLCLSSALRDSKAGDIAEDCKREPVLLLKIYPGLVAREGEAWQQTAQ